MNDPLELPEHDQFCSIKIGKECNCKSNIVYKAFAKLIAENTALKDKLKESSEFIQRLGPTIDYDIVREIEEMLDE